MFYYSTWKKSASILSCLQIRGLEIASQGHKYFRQAGPEGSVPLMFLRVCLSLRRTFSRNRNLSKKTLIEKIG